jgi:hypothetical protein
VILSTEDGRKFAQQELERAMGMAQAEDIIKTAMFMEQQAAELIEAEETGALAAQEFWKSASAEEKEHIIKVANTHQAAIGKLEFDFEKMAYDAGAADAAGMYDQGGMAEQPPGGGAGGMPGGGAAGGMPGGAGGGEQVSDEEVAQVLQYLIQNGEIDEPTAMQIMQQLQGGGAGGAGGGGGGGMPGGTDQGDPGGMPEGAGTPGGDGSGGAPGKGASKKKKSDDDDAGNAKEAAAHLDAVAATANKLVDEAFAASPAAK